MLITFEGIDKSGKTTQANILINYLKNRGFDVIFIREPGGTKISEKIRELLLDSKNSEMFCETEFLLYSASRAQLVNEVIKPALERKELAFLNFCQDRLKVFRQIGIKSHIFF